MDLEVFLDRVRDHYLDQFRDFQDRQREKCPGGGTEVRFELGGAANVFRGLYCADFVNTDNGNADIVELQTTNLLDFKAMDGAFNNMSIHIENFSWDKVSLEYKPQVLTAEALNEWFELWFDAHGHRFDPEAEFNEVIHCVVIDGARIVVDMGTAPVEAFWMLIETLDAAGVREVTID